MFSKSADTQLSAILTVIISPVQNLQSRSISMSPLISHRHLASGGLPLLKYVPHAASYSAAPRCLLLALKYQPFKALLTAASPSSKVATISGRSAQAAIYKPKKETSSMENYCVNMSKIQTL